MNKDNLKKRIKYCPVITSRIVQAKSTTAIRRDPNFVEDPAENTENVVADFFEFEKELSEMKPSNKITNSDNRD